MSLSTVLSHTEKNRTQVLFKSFEWFSSTFQGRFNFQGLFKKGPYGTHLLDRFPLNWDILFLKSSIPALHDVQWLGEVSHPAHLPLHTLQCWLTHRLVLTWYLHAGQVSSKLRHLFLKSSIPALHDVQWLGEVSHSAHLPLHTRQCWLTHRLVLTWYLPAGQVSSKLRHLFLKSSIPALHDVQWLGEVSHSAHLPLHTRQCWLTHRLVLTWYLPAGQVSSKLRHLFLKSSIPALHDVQWLGEVSHSAHLPLHTRQCWLTHRLVLTWYLPAGQVSSKLRHPVLEELHSCSTWCTMTGRGITLCTLATAYSTMLTYS